MSLDEIRNDRLKKLALLKERGVDPYPASSNITITLGELATSFEDAVAAEKPITVGGRVMSIREHCGTIFADLFDGTGKIQGYIKSDVLGEEQFSFFSQTADAGDFIELSGVPTRTKRGEASVLVSSWRMLSKSLRTLPEKWVGLTDPEERLRKRYLDILLNDDVREMLTQKSRFWTSVRSFMQREGFLEVETPILETTTGGADARPFMTHHNALDMDVYLRISAGELWQKRLMVAGFPKVFELGRIFRNEGMSATHLQDYTQMEFYWGYADYEKGMKLVEELYRYVAQETFGTQVFELNGYSVDLSQPWERYDYRETVKKMTGVDVLETTQEEVEAALRKLGVDYQKEGFNITRAIDNLWKYCRKQLSGPGFLVGVPTVVSPLAKRMPSDPRVAERFQPIIGGTELGNGFSELNDPIDQNERFEEQQRMRDAGDDEAQMADLDYVEALEYGMPPTCGFGMSERVFAVLANKPIRETQIFPLMKPRQ